MRNAMLPVARIITAEESAELLSQFRDHVPPDLRDQVRQEIVVQALGFDGVPFSQLNVHYQNRTWQMMAGLLLDYPNYLRFCLRAAAASLGYPYYEPPPAPAPKKSPIGAPWPQKTAEFGVPAYHPAPGSQPYEGQVYQDSTGVYVCHKGRTWVAEYWWWQKVS